MSALIRLTNRAPFLAFANLTRRRVAFLFFSLLRCFLWLKSGWTNEINNRWRCFWHDGIPNGLLESYPMPHLLAKRKMEYL